MAAGVGGGSTNMDRHQTTRTFPVHHDPAWPSPAQVHLPGVREFLLNNSLHCLAQILRCLPSGPHLAAINICLQAEKAAEVRIILRHLWEERRGHVSGEKVLAKLGFTREHPGGNHWVIYNPSQVK